MTKPAGANIKWCNYERGIDGEPHGRPLVRFAVGVRGGSQTNTEPHAYYSVLVLRDAFLCLCRDLWLLKLSSVFLVFNVCAIHKPNICAIYIDAIQQGFHQGYFESLKLVLPVHHLSKTVTVHRCTPSVHHITDSFRVRLTI